jgi:hypothetical protein
VIKPNYRAHYAVSKTAHRVAPNVAPDQLTADQKVRFSPPNPLAILAHRIEPDARSMHERQGHRDHRLRRVGSHRPDPIVAHEEINVG